MKLRTNANLFGVGAGAEFDSELTEFLQDHIDSGLVSVVETDEDPGDVESGPENGAGQPGGAGGQPPAPDAAESVSDGK